VLTVDETFGSEPLGELVELKVVGKGPLDGAHLLATQIEFSEGFRIDVVPAQRQRDAQNSRETGKVTFNELLY